MTDYSTKTAEGLLNRYNKAISNIAQCEARIARGDLGAPEGYVMVKGRRQVCFQVEGTLNSNIRMRDESAKAYCALMQATYPDAAGEFPILA
jgi:hypothetical protein